MYAKNAQASVPMPTVMKNTKKYIVYGGQGISTKTYDEETYRDLLKSDSGEESIIKYNVALCVKDSVSLEKKRR